MVVEAPLVFALMIGGAMVGGVRGAAWGLAIDQTLLIPLWFLQLRAVLRERPPDAGQPRDDPPTGSVPLVYPPAGDGAVRP